MDAPPIQYARTEDGVNSAYWTLGEGRRSDGLHSDNLGDWYKDRGQAIRRPRRQRCGQQRY